MSNPLWEQSDQQKAAITAGNIETSVTPGLTSAVGAPGLFFIVAFVTTSIQESIGHRIFRKRKTCTA